MSEHIERVDVNGLRHYKVTVDDIVIGIFPSMTTILGETKDKGGLDEWRNKIDAIIGRNVLWLPTTADEFSELISIGYIRKR